MSGLVPMNLKTWMKWRILVKIQITKIDSGRK